MLTIRLIKQLHYFKLKWLLYYYINSGKTCTNWTPNELNAM